MPPCSYRSSTLSRLSGVVVASNANVTLRIARYSCPVRRTDQIPPAWSGSGPVRRESAAPHRAAQRKHKPPSSTGPLGGDGSLGLSGLASVVAGVDRLPALPFGMPLVDTPFPLVLLAGG